MELNYYSSCYHESFMANLEPRPLLFPQHWMYCITSTTTHVFGTICRYYETVDIMGLSDIHTNEDGSFRFGGNFIIPNYSYLPAKLDLLAIYL